MMYLLNLGSLLFGLASWIVPLLPLVTRKFSTSRSIKAIFASLVSAVIALIMQMFYTKHLVNVEDWSALMDTQGSRVLAASVLSFVAVLLNGVLLIKSLKQDDK